jgi:asparagine synthase (glutamine-hydrolysing)
MCGITGFIGFNLKAQIKDVGACMVDALSHRGPDDNGIWIDEDLKVFSGHTRLAILDLSLAGKQPLMSFCQRYVIVFNGEIYNHLFIRQLLEKEYGLINWRGHSDTETLANAFSIWGLEKTLKATRGMFALSLWDRQEKKLYLARDRMGEKPLYYGWIAGNFVYASELKSFHRFPQFEKKINQNALNQFLIYSAVPSPLSIYEDVYKLETGCYLEINYAKQVEIKSYWSLADLIRPEETEVIRDEKTAIRTVKNTLRDAVKLQMSSDVPLGAFLSGGVDSSTVVALMQEHSAQKVKTFTIGFDEKHYDESMYAAKVAAQLGTEHQCIVMNQQNLLDVIPKLPQIYDEPFADSSQIPTYLVSQVAKSSVTVALSGDAGDELFGGYTRYIKTPALWKKLSLLPYPIRKSLGKILSSQSSRIGNMTLLEKIGINSGLLAQRCYKLGKNFDLIRDIDDFYHSFLVNGHQLRSADIQKYFQLFSVEHIQHLSPRQRMMYYDSMHYLPNDILTKVDRAAMAVSLETRVPMLDPNVIELAWRLPEHMKFRHGQGKWILKQVLGQYLPSDLIHRPKMGFGIPLRTWLNTSLKDWAESLLSEEKLQEHGLLDTNTIRQLWINHSSGSVQQPSSLWNVLMFQAWYSEYH